jgi:hypothetical protein
MNASHVLTSRPVVRQLTAWPHRWFAAPKVPRCGHGSPVVLIMSVYRDRALVCSPAYRLSLSARRVQRLSMDPELWAGAENTVVGEETRTQAMKSRPLLAAHSVV